MQLQGKKEDSFDGGICTFQSFGRDESLGSHPSESMYVRDGKG